MIMLLQNVLIIAHLHTHDIAIHYLPYHLCVMLSMYVHSVSLQVQRQLDVDVLISGHTHKVSNALWSLLGNRLNIANDHED